MAFPNDLRHFTAAEFKVAEWAILYAMKRASDCHPGKPSIGRGLCRNCYNLDWRKRNPERARQISRDSHHRNREKAAARSKEWRLQNLERARQYDNERSLRLTYGLTMAQYNQLLTDQNGVCAACYRSETATRNGKIKRLAIDHNHATGKIRGLLCQRCNTAIGVTGDSIERLQNLAQYLERTGAISD